MEPVKAPVISRYYLLALGLIALFISASWLGEQTILAKSAQSANQVNISGRQRMLSQRIALLLNQYYLTADTLKRESLKSEINSKTALFYQSYLGLLKGSEQLGLNPEPDLKAYYNEYQIPQLIDHHKQRLQEILLVIEDKNISTDQKRQLLVDFSEKVSFNLLVAFDNLTKRLQEKSEREISQLGWLENILFIGVFVLLILEALFIFRPLVASIRSYIASIEAHAQQLTELDRVRRQFLMNISHIIRTPLNHIVGFSQRLSKNTEGNLSERQLKALTTINHSADYLTETVEDIYQIVTVESDDTPPKIESLTSIMEVLRTPHQLLSEGCDELVDGTKTVTVRMDFFTLLVASLCRLSDSDDPFEVDVSVQQSLLSIRFSHANKTLVSQTGAENTSAIQLLIIELIERLEGCIESKSEPLLITLHLDVI